VKDYRVGDLDANFSSLQLEEDFLYAYGFMPQATWQLLHPRHLGELSPADRENLAIVASQRHLHPRDLQRHFGSRQELNAWGGYSRASTRSLERLHYLGLIRVAGRRGGLKFYEKANPRLETRTPEERLRGLILRISGILAPISETSLRAALRHLRHAAPELTGRASALSALIKSGELAVEEIDRVRYILPASGMRAPEGEETVRFLAPFDPLVWDRRRFEHLWNWAYRFEAYTPLPKRKMGYYALPLLWKDAVIGWVNVSGNGEGYDVKPGFISGRAPTAVSFRRAFAAESERLKICLAGRAA